MIRTRAKLGKLRKSETDTAVIPEEVVVWEYIRWDGKYLEFADHAAIQKPNFSDPAENQLRWDLLAGNNETPGDWGQVLRIRFPFIDPCNPPPYQWKRERAEEGLFETARSNYSTEYNMYIALNDIARQFVCTSRLPDFFDDHANSIVRQNVERLGNKSDLDDFDGVILCRPTPGFPSSVYRVVEGTKRAIAYRVRELMGLSVPEIRCYFGDYTRR